MKNNLIGIFKYSYQAMEGNSCFQGHVLCKFSLISKFNFAYQVKVRHCKHFEVILSYFHKLCAQDIL